MRDRIFGPGFDLPRKTPQLLLDIWHSRICGYADSEVRGGANGVAANIEAMIEASDDIDQSDCVYIKDCRRIRIVAQFRRISGKAKNVLQANRRGPEQVGLDAQHIAVAAGIVQHCLNSSVLLDLDTQALRAHARRGARRIRYIDRVDTEGCQQACAFDFLDAIDPLRRNDFDESYKGVLVDQRTYPGAFGKRHGRNFRVEGGRGAALNLDVAAAARLIPILRIDGADCRLHCPNVIGCGSAAPADILRSGFDCLAREAGHVFGRTEIDVAALDSARHPRVGHGHQRQGSHSPHCLDCREHGRWTSRTVATDHIRPPFGEQLSGMGGRCSVEAVTVVINRNHDKDWQLRRSLLGGKQGFPCLVQGRHGLDHEHVRACFCEGGDLFGKRSAGFFEAGFSQRFQVHTKWSNRAGNPGVSRLLVFQMLGRQACDSNSSFVDLGRPAGQSVPRQPETVGPKGVGFENLGSALQIFRMNCEDQGWV